MWPAPGAASEWHQELDTGGGGGSGDLQHPGDQALLHYTITMYYVQVRYSCQDGSQFDTDGDGLGDSPTIDIRFVS